MKDTWPSCYFNVELRLYLVVYVDDFKLAGPAKHLAEGWKRLRKGLDLDDPAPSGLYLGCQHERFVQGTKGAGISYNMESFSAIVLLSTFALPAIPVAFVLLRRHFWSKTRTPRLLVAYRTL